MVEANTACCLQTALQVVLGLPYGMRLRVLYTTNADVLAFGLWLLHSIMLLVLHAMTWS